jgi:hypothetical protein
VTYHAILWLPKTDLLRIIAVAMFGSPACAKKVLGDVNHTAIKVILLVIGRMGVLLAL